jgi:hypothetical protein
MTDLTLFIGLDVHKKTISVAMVEAAAGALCRRHGSKLPLPRSAFTYSRLACSSTRRTTCRALSGKPRVRSSTRRGSLIHVREPIFQFDHTVPDQECSSGG